MKREKVSACEEMSQIPIEKCASLKTRITKTALYKRKIYMNIIVRYSMYILQLLHRLYEK